MGGNGFLAVYLAGLIMARGDFIHKRSLLRFHDGLAWLMQIAMFLALGLLVFPSRLLAVAGVALLAALSLIFIARPISVALTLLPFRLPVRQKAMVAWVGLRGAVPIILATFPRLAGLPQADLIFDIVFFVVLTSVLLQGTSIPLVARWLNVAVIPPAVRRSPLELTPGDQLKSELLEVAVPAGATAVGRQVLELGLPKGALIALIGRGSEHIVPDGNTVLEPGDHLLILADQAVLAATRRAFAVNPGQRFRKRWKCRMTAPAAPHWELLFSGVLGRMEVRAMAGRSVFSPVNRFVTMGATADLIGLLMPDTFLAVPLLLTLTAAALAAAYGHPASTAA